MRYGWLIVAVAVLGCNKSSPTAPSDTTTPAPPTPVDSPKPGESGWDVLDFMLNESEWAYGNTSDPIRSALPTFRVGPDRWIECKSGGCIMHEAMRYDGSMIYLDEDHSMNGGLPWKVYTAGPWMPRYWVPGESMTTDHCRKWYQHGSCRLNIDCHSFTSTIIFLEFVHDFDFGSDLDKRDIIVVDWNGEINVYARGAGRVYWWGRATGVPYPGWRNGPWSLKKVRVPKSHYNPDEAVTCVWQS